MTGYFVSSIIPANILVLALCSILHSPVRAEPLIHSHAGSERSLEICQLKMPVEELLYQPQDGRASVVRSEEYFFSEIYEDPESFAVELEGLVSTMVEWIGDAGDYEVDHLIAAPPRIFFATVGEILDFGNGPLEIRPGLRGAYSDEIDTLVIVLPWSIDDQVSRSILLHELVHAVQASARDWNCLAEQEWEAYQLQHRWLAEQGLDWTLDWLLVGIMSRCPDTVE